MNIRDLITQLEELAEHAENGEQLEVRMATQPNWPIQTYIACVTLVDDVVFIAEGYSPHDTPYAPRSAWDGGVAGSDCDELALGRVATNAATICEEVPW